MPRQSSTLKDSTGEETITKTKAELRQEALNGVMQVGQLACIAFGQFADAGAIGMHGPQLVSETLTLAENNSKIASKVDLLIEVGPYAGIVAAAIPFLAQLFVNHGLAKAEMFANAGVVPPDTLAEHMKTEMMRKAVQVQREQMEAQRRLHEEMRQMQEEMAANANGQGEYSSENVE